MYTQTSVPLPIYLWYIIEGRSSIYSLPIPRPRNVRVAMLKTVTINHVSQATIVVNQLFAMQTVPSSAASPPSARRTAS